MWMKMMERFLLGPHSHGRPRTFLLGGPTLLAWEAVMPLRDTLSCQWRLNVHCIHISLPPQKSSDALPTKARRREPSRRGSVAIGNLASMKRLVVVIGTTHSLGTIIPSKPHKVFTSFQNRRRTA